MADEITKVGTTGADVQAFSVKAAAATPAPATPNTAFEDLLNITDGEAVKIRLKERTLKGTPLTLPFNGTVAKQTGTTPTVAVLLSLQINERFTIDEIAAVFDAVPTGGTAPQIYFLVSENNSTDETGFNLLSKYSSTPYLTGNATRICTKIDPREFVEGRYFKVYA